MSDNKKLKIGYFADGPWSHYAFEMLIADQDIDIKFIIPRTDSIDDTLFVYSEQYGIPYYKGALVNSSEFYSLAKSYDCDLFVSMSFNQIFRKKIAFLPAYGTINCHAGKLPFYRGRNILNWVLINDEKEFGITVHYIDEGIDTGDIILQRIFPISDEDNYKTLLEISYVECASILYDAIKLVQSGKHNRIEQKSIHPVGFYCGRREQGDEIINWHHTSRNIYNFIRAVCEPGPKALTTIEGVPVKINKAKIVDQSPIYICTIGQIVGQTDRGFIVKTADSTLEIFELESERKIRIGDRLGK